MNQPETRRTASLRRSCLVGLARLVTLAAAATVSAGTAQAAPAAAAAADLSGTPIRLIVPFTAGGSSDIIARSIANQLVNGMLATLPFVQAKRLKILAVSKPTRVALLPNVPTIAETLPGFESGTWQGVMAPKGLPPAVLARISAELLRVIRLPAVREQLVAQGAEVSTMAPADFSRWFEAERKNWATVVAQAGVKLD